jgi:hypothetical protein
MSTLWPQLKIGFRRTGPYSRSGDKTIAEANLRYPITRTPGIAERLPSGPCVQVTQTTGAARFASQSGCQ